MDALGYAKALLDPDRLAVAGLVALRPRTLAELCATTGLDREAGRYWRSGGRV